MSVRSRQNSWFFAPAMKQCGKIYSVESEAHDPERVQGRDEASGDGVGADAVSARVELEEVSSTPFCGTEGAVVNTDGRATTWHS